MIYNIILCVYIYMYINMCMCYDTYNINVQLTKGIKRDEKATIVKEITATIVETLEKKPEHIHIVIQEIEEENWGFSGKLTDDWRQQS